MSFTLPLLRFYGSTIFVVYNSPSGSAVGAAIFDGGALTTHRGGSDVYQIDNCFLSTFTAAQTKIVSTTTNLAGEIKSYPNGGTPTVATATSDGVVSNYAGFIGKRADNVYFNGTLVELILFDRFLKDEERKSIEIYLGKKWGIKVSS